MSEDQLIKNAIAFAIEHGDGCPVPENYASLNKYGEEDWLSDWGAFLADQVFTHLRSLGYRVVRDERIEPLSLRDAMTSVELVVLVDGEEAMRLHPNDEVLHPGEDTQPLVLAALSEALVLLCGTRPRGGDPKISYEKKPRLLRVVSPTTKVMGSVRAGGGLP